MKKSHYSVFRNAENYDCTANGLSSQVTNGYMFWDCTREEAIEYCKENNIDPNKQFFLNKRMLWGEDHSYATPLVMKKGICMFGGNFLYTSNSASFIFKGELVTRPIQIHDRFESQETYDALSI